MRICPHCETPTLDKICPFDGYQTVDAALYMEPEHDPFVGTAFQERYRIEERLAIGGMGTVYRASQVAVGRPVAIKILRQEVVHDLRVVARFQQEALSVAGLHHPNTIRIFDFGQSADGHLFLVMEFLEGESLGDMIDEQAPIEPERVVKIGGQILDALAEAHSNGIIHRDLKPDNIFVTKVGLQADFIKVLDFGIAKLERGEARKRQLTQTGIVVGSPGYMAPEQVQSLPLTAQVDIYAVGAVMYEMLTGKAVFVGESAFEIAMKQVNEDPEPPMVDGKVLKGPVIDCVMSFLAKEPENRPAGAAEALRRLQECIPDENGMAAQVNHILPVRNTSSSMLSADVTAGPRQRRSTSVFFTPSTGLNSFTDHRIWIGLIVAAIAVLGFLGFQFLGSTGDTPPVASSSQKDGSTPGVKSPVSKTAEKTTAFTDNARARASSSGTAKVSNTDKSSVKTGAIKEQDKQDPKAEKKAEEAAPEKKAGKGFVGGVRVYEETSMVSDNEDWVEIKARPSGTRVYLNAGPRPIPLIGKNRVVLAWPKGEKRPKVRLKKRRYESYGFQIPRSWIGLTRTVTLEWDDAY